MHESFANVDFLDPGETETFVCFALEADSPRLQHVLVVADRVRQTARDINERKIGMTLDEAAAYCAALLHDIGYWEPLALTGFHPVDGARFLQSRGYSRLAELIIGHSSSPEEAELRGLPRITPSSDPIAKILTYWDVQVAQKGAILSYPERIADILQRYGEYSIVGRATLLSRPRTEELIRQVDIWRGERAE